MFARSLAALALLALAAGRSGPAAFVAGAGAAGRAERQPQASAVPALPARPAPIASYSIDARLDTSSRTIAGAQTLTWRNATASPTSVLRFHLYYNAWRDDRSSWMREQRLAGRTWLLGRPEEDRGRMDVTRITIGRGSGPAADVSDLGRFIAPDDGNPDDRTVLEVPLPSPVGPGESIEVRMAWTSRVPRTFARTGVVGDYYFVAQWFPKIGVLEESGWNCHQFHAATEFFSDFGAYDVRLTVPRGWIVGATGVEKQRQDGPDGTAVHHYHQEDVHDFAWTTSPDYLEARETFTHPTLPQVTMRLLLQPEHRGQEGRHFDATRAALKYYGEWFGPYPYGHITIVDPAWQSGAGGMEYPTLFTAGTRWLAPSGVAEPEGVTIHEAGHQFWYGVVASNEFEHAWLDEGVNTFAAARAAAEAFGPDHVSARYFGGFVPWVFHDLPLGRESRSLAAYRPAVRSDVPSSPSWQYFPGTAGAITYHKTALWLHTLERLIGWEALQRGLSAYYRRSAFRHPRPADFFAAVNEASGQDLTWFFEQVHDGSDAFDYGVDAVQSEPEPIQGDQGSTLRGGGAGPRYRTTVVARRLGEGIFPVDVRVVFENGEDARWRWDGRGRWKQFTVDGPARAVRADVDPDRVLLLDVNRTNNSAMRERAAPRAARRWSLVWLVWLQDHLLTYGFLV